MSLQVEFRKFVFGDTDRFREIADFGISFGFNVLFATVVLGAFTYLRPRNKAIYARRSKWFKEDEKRPPEIPGDNSPGLAIFGALKLRWVHFIFNIPESLILERLGLDCLMFIRTLALFVRAFIPIAIICAGALIPLDVVMGTTFVQRNKNVLALLTMENLEDFGLRFLWIHAAAAWIFNLYVFYLMYTAYCDYVVLRQQYFTSLDHQRKISSRSLLCLHLPRPLRDDKELERLFCDKIAAETSPPSCAAVGRRVGPLAELIDGHEKAVRKLEGVLARYLKGGKIAAKRPRIRIKGRKEDEIEYWTCLIQNLEKKVQDQCAHSAKFKPMDFGFVSFSSVAQAHKTAMALRPVKVRLAIMRRAHRDKIAEGDTVGIRGNQLPEFILAPEPKDIIWSNLSLNPAARRSRAIFGTILFLALCVLWIFPLTFIASVAKLSALFAAVPVLNDFASRNLRLIGFMEQQIAPILQTVFIMFLPKIFGYITTFQAARTKTGAQRAVFTKLYFFLILTNLFFFALINVGEGISTTVAKSVAAGTPISLRDFGIISVLTRELLVTGNHFLNLVAVRGLLSQPLELAQAADLIGVSIKRWLFASTPRQDREFTKPPPMDFAVQYAFHLFIFTVSFLFAPLVPMIAVAGLIYFIVTYHVYKYQCLYVFDTRIETGGQMWPLVVERVFTAQAISQLALAATLWARGGKMEAYAMLPLVVVALGLHLYTSRRLEPRTRYVAAAYPPGDFKIEGMPSTRKRGARTIVAVKDFQYYDDSQAFARASLADRFTLPALARPLMTPEVRKESRHLLPKVYDGRLEEAPPSGDVPRPLEFKFRDNSDTASIYSMESNAPLNKAAPVVGPRSRLSRAATKRIGKELSVYYRRYNQEHDDVGSLVDGQSNAGTSYPYYEEQGNVAPLDYSRLGHMFAEPPSPASVCSDYSQYNVGDRDSHNGRTYFDPRQQYYQDFHYQESLSRHSQPQAGGSFELRSMYPSPTLHPNHQFRRPAPPSALPVAAPRFDHRMQQWQPPYAN